MSEPSPIAEYVVTLTPKQAAFVSRLGRYLRKQEGWWDDEEWSDDLTYLRVAEQFEALPWDYQASPNGRDVIDD